MGNGSNDSKAVTVAKAAMAALTETAGRAAKATAAKALMQQDIDAARHQCSKGINAAMASMQQMH